MAFGSYTADAELKVTNKPVNTDQILFIPETQKFVRARLTTSGGAVTWYFEECNAPTFFTDPVTGKKFTAVLTTDGGAVTWTFSEVT